MTVSIFFSHSSLDLPIVKTVQSQAAAMGVGVYLHEDHPEPGAILVDKLRAAIENCDALLVLITTNSVPSAYVNQEIGLALGKGLPIIPLVETGVADDRLAMLQGVEYIRFDPNHPHEALRSMTSLLHQMQETKRQRGLARQQRDMQIQQQQLVVMALVVVALVALLIYLDSKKWLLAVSSG